MKTFSKTLLATGLLAAASANAALVDINIYDNATTGSTNFANSLIGGQVVATENFNTLTDLGGVVAASAGDGDGSKDQSSWVARSTGGFIDTGVGRFTLDIEGQEGANLQNNQLMIENSDTGEFGRQGIEDDDGFWLDSNDAKYVTWDFDKPVNSYFNTVGFYLSDAADVNATLKLHFVDGTSTELAVSDGITDQDNGNVKFVNITSDMNILGGSLIFDNGGSKNDGWGIDNVTLGKLPEPGTLLLMGLGLLGLGAARRRAAK